MSWLSNLVGDVTTGIEQVVPGAKQLDQFLNKAGIGPKQAFSNPFKPQGWAGDIEHGLSQASHSPAGRALEEAAAIAAMAYFAPELIPAFTSGGGEAVSAADMTAMMDAGSADVAAMGAETTAADAATIAADAGLPATEAGTAATAAASAAPGALPEIGVNAPFYTTQAPGYYAAANMLPFAAQATAAAQPGATPQSKDVARSYGTDANTAPAAPDSLTGTPGLFGPALAQDPAAFSQFAADPWAPAGTGSFMGTDAQSLADMANAGDLPNISPGSQSWGQFLTSPKGALTATSLGASLYSLMNRAQLPGAAKTALGSAGPAAAQAQTMISSGGQGSPLWGEQKAAIDAQIDQQIQNFSRAVQQNAQNAGQGGANSMVVQSQIAQVTKQLEAQREAMYMAAQQQNVSNAVAELTGANQTLMAIANLQFQEDQAAQQLARNIGLTTGNLASLFPSG